MHSVKVIDDLLLTNKRPLIPLLDSHPAGPHVCLTLALAQVSLTRLLYSLVQTTHDKLSDGLHMSKVAFLTGPHIVFKSMQTHQFIPAQLQNGILLLSPDPHVCLTPKEE